MQSVQHVPDEVLERWAGVLLGDNIEALAKTLEAPAVPASLRSALAAAAESLPPAGGDADDEPAPPTEGSR